MKNHLPSLAVAAGLLIAGALSAVAQNTNVLKVYTAIEVQFGTDTGKKYTLQGSTDLINWVDIGQSILGHGRVVDEIFSTKTVDAVNFASYRLKIEDGPTNGYAPWKMSGRWMVMSSSGGGTNVVHVDDDNRGHDAYSTNRDDFNYTYSRTGENESEIERHFDTNRDDRVTMSYTGPADGTYIREEFRNGGLERRHMGRFHSSTNDPGVTPPPVTVPVAQPPAPPVALTGIKLHVRAGELPIELNFLTTTNGTEEAGESRHGVHMPETQFTYDYTVTSSNTASLNLNFPTNSFDGDRNEYDLTFTDGASGTFTRRTIRAGQVTATDTGIFGPDHAEVESGDDHGGHGEVESGDDKGATVETGDDNGTAVETGDDNGTATETGDNAGSNSGSGSGSGGTTGGGETESGHGGGDGAAL